MKKTLMGLLSLLMVSGFMACGGAGAGDPKEVVKNFFEAVETQNWDEAAKYATKDSKSMIDMMKMGSAIGESMGKGMMDSLKNEMKKKTIVYGEPKIDGDMATITVTVDDESTDFKLKKEEGVWKVAFDKSTMMQTGLEKAGENGEDSEELNEALKALESLGSDSVKDALNKAGELLQSDTVQKALQDAGEALKKAGEAVKDAGKQ